MRNLAKIASVAMLVLLVVVPIAYSAAHGNTTWWHLSKGSVLVDGIANGYLHENWSGTAVIVTRTDSKRSQSYFVALSGTKLLISCGKWHAPRLIAFPTGDVNPPCRGFNDDPDYHEDLPKSSTESIRPGLIEFSTNSGKKVRAAWR